MSIEECVTNVAEAQIRRFPVDIIEHRKKLTRLEIFLPTLDELNDHKVVMAEYDYFLKKFSNEIDEIKKLSIFLTPGIPGCGNKKLDDFSIIDDELELPANLLSIIPALFLIWLKLCSFNGKKGLASKRLVVICLVKLLKYYFVPIVPKGLGNASKDNDYSDKITPRINTILKEIEYLEKVSMRSDYFSKMPFYSIYLKQANLSIFKLHRMIQALLLHTPNKKISTSAIDDDQVDERKFKVEIYELDWHVCLFNELSHFYKLNDRFLFFDSVIADLSSIGIQFNGREKKYKRLIKNKVKI